MAEHFGHVASLTKRNDTSGVDLDNVVDVKLVLGMLLHAADVSNPAKQWDYYMVWTDRVMQEFYTQGDKEKEMGMKVTDGYDRANPTPSSKFQNGFMAFIIKPLYEELDRVPIIDMKIPLENIHDNLLAWKRIAENVGKKEAAGGGRKASFASNGSSGSGQGHGHGHGHGQEQVKVSSPEA